MDRHDIRKLIIAVLELALISLLIVGCVGLVSEMGLAEDAEGTEIWILCREGDYINIRARATKKSEGIGIAECGDRFRTDGKRRNGFVHLVGFGESGEGWVYGGYVVNEEPEMIGREMTVTGAGRVACRKWIGGKRRCWVQPGETVTVYRATREWAVTNKGFVMREYLGEK